MAKILYTLSILFFLFGFESEAKNIKAIFSHAQYLHMGDKPYAETYLLVNGNSVIYNLLPNGQFQSKVLVSMNWLQNNKVIKSDQYNLLSPETKDTANVLFNFIDQQRYSLPNGEYVLELKITDANDSKPGFVSKIPVIIQFLPSDSLSISDIHLVDKATKAEKMSPITKSGYDLIPKVSSVFPKSDETLTAYFEIYNANKHLGDKQKYLANYYLLNTETQQKVNSTFGFKRFEASKVAVFIPVINLKDVRSGQYELVVEIVNAENKIIRTKSIEIQRINDLPELALTDISKLSLDNSFLANYGLDSLSEFIACLFPISTIFERRFAENQLNGQDKDLMEKYLINFWQQRNPANPQLAWQNYQKQVNAVNKLFSTLIRKGHATDRGRVYLQYGTPDTRNQNYREPAAYPYEIWHYYRIEKQTNRRFVFYNPDLISNEFPLIYSNANGEIMDEQWQFKIMRRDSQTNDFDQNNTNRHWGSQMQDNFQLPR